MDVKYRSSNNKLYESEVAMQVIGSIYTRPSILDEDGKRRLEEINSMLSIQRPQQRSTDKGQKNGQYIGQSR